MKRYYCTYFDKNYLIKGLGLIESLNRHEKEVFQVFVVCLDELTRTILNKLNLPNVKTIPLHEIEQRDFPLLEAKQNRSLVEYYWTLTGTVILRILEGNPGIDVLTYLDADLFFYSSLDPIFDELGNYSILIHEHRFPPSRAYQLAYGKYNVGLLCFRNDENGIEALKWWRDRCIEWCYKRIEDGKFGDQLYLNDWPTRFKNVVVLQNIGAGVGPWNHEQYSFSKGSGDCHALVDNLPLVFYHFHSIAFVTPEIVIPSKIASNSQTKDILCLCFVPYLNTLSKLIERVRTVLPDFDFGIKNEAPLEYRHTFLAKREMEAHFIRAAVPHGRLTLDEDWNCYCSTQLLEYSTRIDNINDLLEIGETAGALLSVKDGLAEFPNAQDLLALQAELEHDGNEKEKALNNFLESCPNCAFAHGRLGKLYFDRNSNDKVLYHYEKAVELEPNNVVYQKALADFYHNVLGRTEEALQLYLKILNANPADIENLLMLGHLSVSFKKFDSARVFYNKVIEFEPGNTDAKERLDELGERQKTEDRGRTTKDRRQRAELQGIREIGSPEELYQTAQRFMEGGKEKEAIGALRVFLGLYPDYALAHNDLGVLYYNEGNKEKALKHYEQASQLEPNSLTFQKNLADYYYFEMERIEEALKIYNTILSESPEDLETLLVIGHICIKLDKVDNAIDFYNRVLEIDPDNANAIEVLSQVRKTVS
jgi:tetratricopeptide (TPR) repeat protein